MAKSTRALSRPQSVSCRLPVSAPRPIVGCSMEPPYAVYLDHQEVANYGDDSEAAETHFQRLKHAYRAGRGAA